MQFFPDDNENRFLEHALEGSIGLVNIVFRKLPLEMRQRLNELVFAGARVAVAIEMSPSPTITGTITAHETTIQLFRIESPPETQTETTH